MPFAQNRTPDVMSLRPEDGVQLAVERDASGIRRLDISLAQRGSETHCLVAFPSMDVTVPTDTPVRLRMGARYVDPDSSARVPFVVYFVGYRGGVQVGQQQSKFIAGGDPALTILDVEFSPEWESYELVIYADRRLRGTITLWDPHFLGGVTEYWFGPDGHVTRPVDRRRSWYQEGRRAVCQSPFGHHWAEMPEGWRLEAVHPAALAAADWVLYSPLERLAFGVTEPAPTLEPPRPPGTEALLSFSLGTDSTAALTLLPDDTKRYYCQRPYTSYFSTVGAQISLPDPSPWEERLKTLQHLTVVPNTFELARIAAGGKLGFGHAFGYVAVGLLLADHLHAGSISFGSVMEQVFLRSGHLFTDIVALTGSSYNGLRRLLDGAGLYLTLPTGGCSEVLTSKISEAGRFSGLAISCPRAASDGTPCGTCFKCFRKLRLDGRPDVPAPDLGVEHILEKYPLKSATSVVYAAQRSGFRHKALDRYRKVNLDFLERYFGYAVDHMMPPHLAAHAKVEFARLGIEPMKAADERRLRETGKVFWPEQFDAGRAGLLPSRNFG